LKTLLALLFGGLKLAKLGKLLTTGGSMAVSVAAYAGVFGWPYAVGFVALLLRHEMGHYLAARQRGLEVGAPTFIPFVGAWIELKDRPMNAETEAYVAIAGPLAGTAAALACYFLARSQHSMLLLALSYSGFFLNLFNLIPLPPLDGGRLSSVISTRLWLLGAPLLVAVFLWRPSPLLVLIALLAVPRLWRTLKGADARPADDYAATPFGRRAEYALLYLGLIAFLALMSHDLHRMLGRV